METFRWSSDDRVDLLKKSAKKQFDVVIIGGGITGAGIALDATLRGLSVLLLEAGDFASGTSSKSTKLIHGGLRYLKEWEWDLVRKVGRERQILHKNAPHLVHPEELLLPFRKGDSLGPKSAKMALWLYEKLAGVPKQMAYKILTPEALHVAEPLTNMVNIVGAAKYIEYRTDDTRLTLEILKTAVKNGATAINYCKVTGLNVINGRCVGVHARERFSKNTYTFKAKYCVNAAGPWVDEIRQLDLELGPKNIRHTKGVHLVFKRRDFPLKTAVYFEAADKRMIFAIPRNEYVYLGTTDTDYSGNLDELTIQTQDAEYLMAAWNRHFTGKRLTKTDICSGWVGIRPLIQQEGKGPSEVSRKDELFISKSGLISIAGGKLTGYRLMAQKVCDRIMQLRKREFNLEPVTCRSDNFPLMSSNFTDYRNWAEYAAVLWGQCKEIGLDENKALELVRLFGRQADVIIEMVYHLWPLQNDKSKVIEGAILEYCRHFEMCVTPADYYIRRKSLLYFDIEATLAAFEMDEQEWMSLPYLSEDILHELKYEFYRDAERLNSALVNSR
jgi:glycerol-3-phosphate dehydrogenase